MGIAPFEETKRTPRVNINHLDRRLTSLEQRVLSTEKTAAASLEIAGQARDAAQIAADNTTELLAVVTATKGIAALAKKHGPRVIAFVFGIAGAAGFGNPRVVAFVQNFFG